MNTHIGRWKKQYEAVQKVIDGLPESPEQTAELWAEGNNDKTISENSQLDQDEEKKDGAVFSDKSNKDVPE